jgi:RNA polymerase sigma factor (sigma-70 family)
LAQEALLRAYRALHTLADPERFGPWLCGIGLNICRRLLRERSMFPLVDLHGGVLAREVPDREPSPHERAEEAELGETVRRAVASLPAGQRAAVLLHYLSGLTYAETAAALGIEVGAVKTRLHKARARLRRELWSAWKEDEMSVESELKDLRVVDMLRYRTDDGEGWEQVVILREEAGDGELGIWVGGPEAAAIAFLLEGIETPRPLTYAFAAAAITALGGRLREVRITHLVDKVIFASAALEGPQGAVTIDARPSDALALALALEAPIRIEPEALAALSAGPGRRYEGKPGQGAAEIVAETARIYAAYAARRERREERSEEDASS